MTVPVGRDRAAREGRREESCTSFAWASPGRARFPRRPRMGRSAKARPRIRMARCAPARDGRSGARRGADEMARSQASEWGSAASWSSRRPDGNVKVQTTSGRESGLTRSHRRTRPMAYSAQGNGQEPRAERARTCSFLQPAEAGRTRSARASTSSYLTPSQATRTAVVAIMCRARQRTGKKRCLGCL